LTFSFLESREKDEKMNLVAFEYLMSLKGQVLRWNFSFNEFENERKDYQTTRKTAKGLSNNPQNCIYTLAII